MRTKNVFAKKEAVEQLEYLRNTVAEVRKECPSAMIDYTFEAIDKIIGMRMRKLQGLDAGEPANLAQPKAHRRLSSKEIMFTQPEEFEKNKKKDKKRDGFKSALAMFEWDKPA